MSLRGYFILHTPQRAVQVRTVITVCYYTYSILGVGEPVAREKYN